MTSGPREIWPCDIGNQPVKHHKTMKHCSSCKKMLIRLEWSRKVDLAVCDNWECPKYRQPQVNLKRRDW